MTSERMVAGERGVSDVVGIAILISLSIAGSLVILAFGGMALNTFTEQAEHDLADDSLRNVDARLSALADSPVDETTTVTFPDGAARKIEANASAGRLIVTARTKSTYTEYTARDTCSVTQTMGTIVHEKENSNEMVYQGGGLWKNSLSGTQVESEPMLDYDGGTIRFSFVNISGLDGVSTGEKLTASKLSDESRALTANVTDRISDCYTVQGGQGTVPVEIDVTISSRYYDGWARYAKRGMTAPLDDGDVTVDAANNNVTLHFPDIGNKSGPFTNPSRFGGNVIYTGLSQYARFNDGISPHGESGFTVDRQSHQVGFFYQEEEQWLVHRGGNWEYADPSASGAPDETSLPVSTSAGSQTVYDFADDQAVCVVGGNSNVWGYLQGNTAHCLENMVGMDGINQSGATGSGVVYVGPAGDDGALNYFDGAYSDTVYNDYGQGGGPDCVNVNGSNKLCDEATAGNGYILDPVDDPEYDIYAVDVDDKEWVEYDATHANHSYVYSGDTSAVAGERAYNHYRLADEMPVCIATEGTDVDPSEDCGQITVDRGGEIEYEQSRNVLDVRSDRGNLSLLTAQIGERINETETVRVPQDVMFVLDESGSMAQSSAPRVNKESYKYLGSDPTEVDGVEQLCGYYNCYDYYRYDSAEYLGFSTTDDPNSSAAAWEPGLVPQYDYDDRVMPIEEDRTYILYDVKEMKNNLQAQDPNEKRITATKNFLGELNSSTDRAGIVQFDTEGWVEFGLTEDLQHLKDNLNSDAGNGTNIGDGMREGLDELESANGDHQQIMVLLSDGYNNQAPDYLVKQQAERAAENNVTIYTIGLGPATQSDILRSVANETGGEFYPADDADELTGIFETIRKESEPAAIQRSHTEVAAVTESGQEWSVSLDGSSNLNDPTQFNSSNSKAIETTIQQGLNNSDLSFEVTVYGCNNYTTVGDVTSTVDGEEYVHTRCVEYGQSDTTTITNDDTTDHVIITADNGNSLADVSASGDWQPDPSAVAPKTKSDLGEGEAIIGLEVTHENQSGYVLLHFEVPDREHVRDDWQGNLGDGETNPLQGVNDSMDDGRTDPLEVDISRIVIEN